VDLKTLSAGSNVREWERHMDQMPFRATRGAITAQIPSKVQASAKWFISWARSTVVEPETVN